MGSHETTVPRKRLAVLLLVLACIGVYANSFQGAYHMDDGLRIFLDESIRHPLGAMLGTSRPVVGLSLWFNHATGGSRFGFHLFNLVIHILAAVTLFDVLHRIYQRWPRRPVPALPLAWAGALLWAVHPLQTESVTYIIQRSEAMMGLGFFLAFRFALMRMMREGRMPWKMVSAAAVCMCVSIMSKPVMIVGPLLILLYDALEGGGVRRAIRSHGRLYMALALASVWGVVLMLLPNESSTTVGVGQGLIAPWRYALTQPAVILHYLRLSLVPVGLCFDYAWLPATVSIGSVTLAGLLVVMILFSIGMYGRQSMAGYAALFVWVALAPTSSLVPIADIAAEHRMYVPLAAVMAVVTTIVAHLVCQWLPNRYQQLRAVMLAWLLLAALFGAGTVGRNRLYASRLVLSRDSVEKRPDNFRARSVYVASLLDAGQADAALTAGTNALAHARKRYDEGGVYAMTGAMNAGGYMPVLLNGVGRAWLAKAEWVRSLPYFDEAVGWRRDLVSAHINAAIALRELGQFADAHRAVSNALEQNPRSGRAYTVRASLRLLEGEHDDAAADLQRATELGDGDMAEQVRLQAAAESGGGSKP